MSAVPGPPNQIETQVESIVASDKTKMMIESSDYFPLFPTPKHKIDDAFKVNVDPWVKRPFYVGRGLWTTASTRFSSILINSASSGNVVNLPRDVFNASSSLYSIMRAGRLFRCKMCINLSLTGTLTHSGILLAAVLPPSTTAFSSDSGRLINLMLSGPHAFLSANEATTVCLEVPFYCNNDYAVMDPTPASGNNQPADFATPNSNFAQLAIMVLNPLSAADGSSTTLTILADAFFKELELYVPAPASTSWVSTAPTSSVDFPSEEKEGQSFLAKAGTRIIDSTFGITKYLVNDGLDALRGVVRRYTGLHNPNVASLDDRMIMTSRNYLNSVDSATRIEKLDPYSCVDRIVQEPSFHTADDEMLMSNILSKPQYLGTFQVSTTMNVGALLFAGPICPYQGGTTNSLAIANNIELMYHLTRAWKGDLNLHIQSAMNNKQCIKLRVTKFYSPSTSHVSNYPTMNTTIIAPADLLEYTQGNQVQDVLLPFNARNSLVYNTRNYQDSTGSMVGMYYVYLAQPMVVGDSSPLSAEFNVYMSCAPNFSFYGYSTEVGIPRRFYAAAVEAKKPKPKEKEKEKPKEKLGQSASVMNQPSNPTKLLQHTQDPKEIDDSRLVPLVDIRPLIRRFQFARSGLVTIDPVLLYTNVVFPLAPFIGESISSDFVSSALILPHLYYGKQCGLKFKLVTSGSSYVNVSFIPPNTSATTGSSGYMAAATPNVVQVGHWANFPAGGAKPGFYPVNQIEYPNAFQLTNLSNGDIMGEYEFIVPNVTPYNFVGSNFKMDGNFSNLTRAEGDMGSIVFTFVGAADQVISYNLFAAFTDESRFGFQTLCPVVSLSTFGGRLCTPNSNSSGTNPVITPTNEYLYFTNLKTTYNTG